MVAKQATELRYAVRFRVVFKYFGQLCLVLAGLTLAPLVMAVIFGDTPTSLRYGIVVGGLAAFGAGLARLRAPSRVQANEGMVLVAMMFLFTPLVMSYPMMGSGLGFLDAFFEAISGVTTTGLSTKAIAKAKDTGAAKNLKLPVDAKVICYYRDGRFSHADEETTFRIDDEVVILTHCKNIPTLQERWQPKPAQEQPADSA